MSLWGYYKGIAIKLRLICEQQRNNVLREQNRNVLIMITSCENVVRLLQVYLLRNDKIMTNSEIEPFPSYSPSQRTKIYNIILINYRWDGELMLDRGLRPLSN